MDRFTEVIKYLRRLPPDFYGQVIVKIGRGRAVLITEEKTVKLGNGQDIQDDLRERLS